MSPYSFVYFLLFAIPRFKSRTQFFSPKIFQKLLIIKSEKIFLKNNKNSFLIIIVTEEQEIPQKAGF